MKVIDLQLDQAEVDRQAQLLVTSVLTAAKGSVGKHTKGLERDLEALTKQHAGGNLWRAWASSTNPGGNRLAYNPVGSVYVNGGNRTQSAMVYWTQAGVNRAKSGGYLAIPTDNAGVNNRSRSMTPGEWEQRNGIRLEFVYRDGGKPSLLVAPSFRARNGSGVRANTAGRRKGHYAGAQAEMIPIFVLIPLQRFANKFAIEPVAERRAKMMRDDFDIRMARLGDRLSPST